MSTRHGSYTVSPLLASLGSTLHVSYTSSLLLWSLWSQQCKEAIEEQGPLIRQTGKQYRCFILTEGSLPQVRAAQGIVISDPEKEDVFPQDPLDGKGQVGTLGWPLCGGCE